MGILDFLFGKTTRGSAPSTPAPKPLPLSPLHRAKIPQVETVTSPRDGRTHWRESPGHCLLLTRFLFPQKLAAEYVSYWDRPLGESAEQAIARFCRERVLVTASAVAAINATFRVIDLKPLLKARGLKQSGKKEELVQRMALADPAWMEITAANLHLYEVAEHERAFAQNVVTRRREERCDAMRESLAHLKRHDFRAARDTVARFEARQVFPRGVDVGDSDDEPGGTVGLLRAVSAARLRILEDLAPNEWEPLRIAAGMSLLWGTNSVREWLPETFGGVARFDADTAARMLVFYAYHHRDLASYRALGIKRASVSAATDACETCKRLAGAAVLLDRLPELPHADCTHPMGCRCGLSPDMSDY